VKQAIKKSPVKIRGTTEEFVFIFQRVSENISVSLILKFAIESKFGLFYNNIKKFFPF